jgi:hypothetical protein
VPIPDLPVYSEEVVAASPWNHRVREARIQVQLAGRPGMPIYRNARFLAAVVLTVVVAYFLFRYSAEVRKNVAVRDSIAYWASARLLITHQNPYDPATVFALERTAGYTEGRPLVLRTPPWSLFMVLPLGQLSPFLAWAAWLAILVACLVVGLRLTRKLYDLGFNQQTIFPLIAYTFAPVAACLVSGQMGLVLMLGIILFLFFEQEHPFFAGAALILPFAKPHLLSLFWFVFAIWVVAKRKTLLALGFISAFTAATLIALFFDYHVFANYREMLQVAAIQKEFIPAFSGVLRLLFFRRFFWLQFVPLGIGIVWTVRYAIRNWPAWDWRVHGPALLVVSVLTTPYEWLSDETVLIPSILQAVALVYSVRGKLKPASKVMLSFFALLNVLLLLILRFKIPFSTGIYFWSSLVWFGFYFYTQKLYRRGALSSERAVDGRA